MTLMLHENVLCRKEYIHGAGASVGGVEGRGRGAITGKSSPRGNGTCLSGGICSCLTVAITRGMVYLWNGSGSVYCILSIWAVYSY
jgi:hypothetical protein